MMAVYLAEKCRFFLAQFVFPDCLKCSLEWNSSTAICQLIINKLRFTTMMFYSQKWPRNLSMTEFLFLAIFLFFTGLLLLTHSYLSPEAETWRRTASLALSATEQYIISDMKMYVFKKSRVYKMQRNVWNLFFSER